MELSLPEAVMKLKQGFGRLMRRRTDGGVVFILDPRVIRKSYGKAFISSLPETRIAVKGQRDLLNEVEDFLFSTDFQDR
jgi:ATP-dependent DNA helicase DinG